MYGNGGRKVLMDERMGMLVGAGDGYHFIHGRVLVGWLAELVLAECRRH